MNVTRSPDVSTAWCGQARIGAGWAMFDGQAGSVHSEVVGCRVEGAEFVIGAAHL